MRRIVLQSLVCVAALGCSACGPDAPPTAPQPSPAGEPAEVSPPTDEPTPPAVQTPAAPAVPDWYAECNIPKYRAAGRREPEPVTVITVTPAAVAQLRKDVGRGTSYVRVRIEVIRGPMSDISFRNRIDLVDEVFPEFDFIDTTHGFPVLVDRRSADYLAGITLDWKEIDGRWGYHLAKVPR